MNQLKKNLINNLKIKKLKIFKKKPFLKNNSNNNGNINFDYKF